MLSLSLPYPRSKLRFRGSLLAIVAITCSVFSLLTSNGWLAAAAFGAVLLLALQERLQPKDESQIASLRCRAASIPDGGTTASLKVLRRIERGM